MVAAVLKIVAALMTLQTTVILAALGFLWRELTKRDDRRKKEIEDIQESLEHAENRNERLWNELYGREYDPTDEGHLSETQSRFDEIDEELSEVRACMEREHHEVMMVLREMKEALEEINGFDINWNRLEGDD